MAILQHAQNLGETGGKVHLSESFSSPVWRQATRILLASAKNGASYDVKAQMKVHPDLLREWTRLLVHIPELFATERGYATQGAAAWFSSNESGFSTYGSLLSRDSTPRSCLSGDKEAERLDMWGHPKSKIKALVERLIAECSDPSLWLEAVVLSSRRLFAEYRQRRMDFFFHRDLYSYLGTTFFAQKSRWSADGYPFSARVRYLMWAFGKLPSSRLRQDVFRSRMLILKSRTRSSIFVDCVQR